MSALSRLLPGLAAYPDVHPMLVHFPIALLPVALLFALHSLRRHPELIRTARRLLFGGTVGMLAAALAGWRAQSLMPHGPGSLVSVHRSYMLAASAMALLLSLWAWRSRNDLGLRSRRILTLGLLIVTSAVMLGADRGALVALRYHAGLGLSLPSPSPAGTGNPADAAARSPAPGDLARGEILYKEFSCDHCHGPDRRLEAPGIPPDLAYAGSKPPRPWPLGDLLHPHRIRWVDA